MARMDSAWLGSGFGSATRCVLALAGLDPLTRFARSILKVRQIGGAIAGAGLRLLVSVAVARLKPRRAECALARARGGAH